MNLREAEVLSRHVCFKLLLGQSYLGRTGEQGWGPVLVVC